MKQSLNQNRVFAVVAIAIISISGVTGALIGMSLIQVNTTRTSEPFYPVDDFVLSLRTFADYVDYEIEYECNGTQYTLEEGLANVFNLDSFAQHTFWTQDILEQIESSYFAAIPQCDYTQFSDLYLDNYEHQIPSFVTTDSILHAYHVLYDIALRRIEASLFVEDISLLSKHMVEVLESYYTSLNEEHWKEAALRNIVYFSVAAKLVDPTWSIPTIASGLASDVLALIDSASQMTKDWFMEQMEDFTQYIPRGHYTKSVELEKYFRAMMWFGRIGFRLNPGDYWCTPEENLEKGQMETAQAILISTGLFDDSGVIFQEGDANSTWSRLYDTTTFFVGKSDDLSPYEYREIASIVYGDNYTLTSLENETLLYKFTKYAESYRDPRILSGVVSTEYEAEEVTKGLRFMGQRFVPDSYILGQLVFDNVGNMSLPRLLPKGLDIMSVLGSERALELLQDQTIFENYTVQMDILKEEFVNISLDTWTQNLYWLWLYSLKTLLQEPEIGMPSFMQTRAWTDKQLTNALSSWTELRHDTVLYVKQSYTSLYYSMPQLPPPGYVEPIPDLYARLASLCRMMLDGLSVRGLLDEELEYTLQGFLRTLLRLEDISIKELTGTPLNSTDYDLLKYIGNSLNKIEGLDDEGGKAALAVDVHTDPNGQRVLQEATGNPMLVYVAVPNVDGLPFLARGAMYSYYEFAQPMSERLTDEAWWAMMDSDDMPSMPDWTSSFVVSGSFEITFNQCYIELPGIKEKHSTPVHIFHIAVNYRDDGFANIIVCS